ncbi:MAG TPA: hypothetical protein VEL49_03780 [Ktedonobacteraceae bacterium]|nr:hypothetical protein [Ktedonobacteraceae bacterium]
MGRKGKKPKTDPTFAGGMFTPGSASYLPSSTTSSKSGAHPVSQAHPEYTAGTVEVRPTMHQQDGRDQIAQRYNEAHRAVENLAGGADQASNALNKDKKS